MNVTEAAINAEVIHLTARNADPSIDWLRSAGIDAPDFDAPDFGDGYHHPGR